MKERFVFIFPFFLIEKQRQDTIYYLLISVLISQFINICIYYFTNTYSFRDSLIDYLYQENIRQRQEVNHLLMDHQQIVADFRNRVLELESTLSTKVSAYRTHL